MTITPDDRSRLATASHWVSRIMTISLEMVVPGLVGLWLDRRLHTVPLLMLVGCGVGITTAIWHLLQMTGGNRGDGTTRGSRERGDGKQ